MCGRVIVVVSAWEEVNFLHSSPYDGVS